MFYKLATEENRSSVLYAVSQELPSGAMITADVATILAVQKTQAGGSKKMERNSDVMYIGQLKMIVAEFQPSF